MKIGTWYDQRVPRVSGPSSDDVTRSVVMHDDGADVTHAEGKRGDAQKLPRGAQVGRYVVLDRIGAGGMGVVYSAYDPELDRRVAIKLLRPGVARDKQQRLLREAQAMARLSHPNVVGVHDVGTFGEQVFIACEFIDGPSLDRWRDLKRPRPWREILAIYLEAGRGLAAAHSAGLMHRDFKPQNVLVDPLGHARVLDFGLARSTEELFTVAPDNSEPHDVEPPPISTKALETPLTRAGTIVGTPAYMSPEQLRGEPVDARTDQFSFCVALHEALYNERPFVGDTQAFVDHGSSVQRPPRAETDVPPAVRALLLRGLSLKPGDRFALLGELLDGLELLRGQSQRPPSRRWVPVALAAAAAVVAVAGTIVVRERRERTMCSGADGKLAPAWNDARRNAIAAAFTRSGSAAAGEAWKHAESALDKYARRWAAAWTDSCEATHVRGEQSAELLDLRTQCFDERLGELRATTDLLAGADAKLVNEAGRAVAGLSRIEDCGDVAALKAPERLPTDAATREKVAAIEADLATARTFSRAGRYRDVLAPATRAVDAARRLHARALEGEALFELGNAQYRGGDGKTGIATTEEAAIASVAGHDDLHAGMTWATLVFFGDETGALERADVWSRLGLAISERLGNPPQLLGKLYNNTATLIDDEGRHADAVDLYKKAIAIDEKLEDPVGLAMACNNLAVTLATLGRDDEALPLYRRAFTLWNDALGPMHPNTLMALDNVAEVLKRMDLLDEAEASVLRSLAAREKVLGADHPDNWFAVGILADIEYRRGKFADAQRHAEEQARLLQQGFGGNSPRLLSAYLMLGEIYAKTKQPVRSRSVLERALAIDAKHDEIMSAEVRFKLGEQLYGEGDRTRARTLIDEARLLVAPRNDPRAVEEKKMIATWIGAHREPEARR
jgi:eukaryotic-like serine/threonine-protein kinase